MVESGEVGATGARHSMTSCRTKSSGLLRNGEAAPGITMVLGKQPLEARKTKLAGDRARHFRLLWDRLRRRNDDGHKSARLGSNSLPDDDRVPDVRADLKSVSAEVVGHADHADF